MKKSEKVKVAKITNQNESKIDIVLFCCSIIIYVQANTIFEQGVLFVCISPALMVKEENRI